MRVNDDVAVCLCICCFCSLNWEVLQFHLSSYPHFFVLKYRASKEELLVSETRGPWITAPVQAEGWEAGHRLSCLVRSPACAQGKGIGTRIRGTALPWAAGLTLQLTQHLKGLRLCRRADFGRLWREGLVLLFLVAFEYPIVVLPFSVLCVTGLLFQTVCLLICLAGWL